MDFLINQLNDLNILKNIGNPNFTSHTKRGHLRGISNMTNPINNEDLVQAKNRVANITLAETEVFNRNLINSKAKLDGYLQSEHGIINVGAYYSNYTLIRNKVRHQVVKLMDKDELTGDQKAILVYCLLPIYYLPDYNSNYNPDNPKGEKTFSKMLLNLAVMQAKSRYEYITGMWDYRQQFVLN